MKDKKSKEIPLYKRELKLFLMWVKPFQANREEGKESGFQLRQNEIKPLRFKILRLKIKKLILV